MKFKKNKNVYFVLFYQYKCYFYTTVINGRLEQVERQKRKRFLAQNKLFYDVNDYRRFSCIIRIVFLHCLIFFIVIINMIFVQQLNIWVVTVKYNNQIHTTFRGRVITQTMISSSFMQFTQILRQFAKNNFLKKIIWTVWKFDRCVPLYVCGF